MKKFILPLILILILSFTLMGYCDWLSGWDKRIEIKIEDYANDIGASVTWFPVTVFLTSTQGEEVFVELTTDAEYLKVAFTKADGITQLYGEKELFDVSEELGIYHVSRDGWTIDDDTSIFLYYDKDHADNIEYISDTNSLLIEKDAIDDLDCNQGVATDGTYLYTVSSALITKHNMSGDVLDTHVDAHLAGTDMEQINSIHIYDGKLYIGANNYAEEPKLGYIKVFDADDLSYIEEHQVLDHWCEGCAYYDGYFWVVYCEYKYVSKYNTSWEWQADYAVDYPTTGDEKKIGYQGITWKGSDIFCSIHEGEFPCPTIDRYHWTGSAFKRQERLIPPDDAVQGICYLASNDRFYIAQRNHPEAGKHSVTITELKSAMAGKSVWDEYFKFVSHQADATTSTIRGSTSNNNDGTKKDANEPNQVDGKVGRAQDFDGSDDYISIPHAASIDFADEDFTISFIVKATENDLVTGMRIFCKGLSAGAGKRYETNLNTDLDTFAFTIDDGATKSEVVYADLTNWADGNYHLITLIRDTTNNLLKIYNDGVFKVSDDDITGSIANSNDLQLGRKDPDEVVDIYYDGIMDETHISGTVRSDAWLKAEYNSLWDSLFTYGSEEEAPVGWSHKWNTKTITNMYFLYSKSDTNDTFSKTCRFGNINRIVRLF